jgi:6-phosphogluconolactonase (cycloisomerase 2 family)
MFRSLCPLFVASLTAAACSVGDPSQSPEVDLDSEVAIASQFHRHAVFTMSNELDANRIVVFERTASGSLRPGNAYATGGRGTAAGLGSQGALVFDENSQQFLAVNAGDSSISLIQRLPSNALSVLANVPSGGVDPVSITRAGDLVYVVNAGDATTPASIAGFRIRHHRMLDPISGSQQPLSAAQVGPAQIQFSPDGALLVVTEKATNMIDTYAVTNGVASAPTSQASAGQTPFGFAFSDNGQLLVSDAFGGGDGLGDASSYAVAADGTLTAITATAPSTQSAPCWLVTANGHAYVTNTKSSTITSYTVGGDGMLALDQPTGIAAGSAHGPIDAAVSNGVLYVLAATDHAIGSYTIAGDGSLTRQPDLAGISPTAVGLVAR